MNGRVRIHLDPPYVRTDFASRVFVPGDTIGGKVLLVLEKNDNLQAVRVELKGKYKVRIGSGQQKKDWQYILLSINETVSDGPQDLRPGSYEYPFNLLLPEKFQYQPTGLRNDSLFAGQTDPGMYAIPPTCEDADTYAACSIRYRVKARAIRRYTVWKDKVNLAVTTFRTEIDPCPGYREAAAQEKGQIRFRLTKDGIPRALGTRESVLNVIRSSHDISTINFTLTARAPTSIVIGKQYPLAIILAMESATGNMESIPEFRLKDYSLVLKNRSNCRYPGVFDEIVTSITGRIPLAIRSVNCTLPPNTAREVLNAFPSTAGYAPPNFVSFAMRRTYGLEIKATVSCLEEEFKFTAQWGTITLHSSRMEFEVEDAIGALESVTSRSIVDDSGPGFTGLPSYEASQEHNTAEPPAYGEHSENVE